MMETLLSGWNGETVIIRHDRPSDAWIFIAVHSTRLGSAMGGTRMKSYPDIDAALRDAMRLAEGMTFKFAASGLPFGGGKAVIGVPADLEPKSRAPLLRRYGALLKQLGGLFRTGPDVGTTPADMDVIAETGAPYVLARTAGAGGTGDPGPFTALGVITGIAVACEHVFGESSVRGRRVLVQGAGDVGRSLINYLREAGAEVLFSDIDEGVVRHFRDKLGLRFVPPEAVYHTECDVFAPCALGSVLNANTIPQLNCRAVVGSANNQLDSRKDAEALRSRGILYAPDYVVNVGGVIAVLGLETKGWSKLMAEEEVADSVRRILRRIFELAKAENTTTEAAARKIAENRLSAGA